MAKILEKIKIKERFQHFFEYDESEADVLKNGLICLDTKQFLQYKKP